MLLLFAVNPGRGKELRTLRLSPNELEEQEIQNLARSFPEGDNAIIFLSEGPVWLIEGGYKTTSKYGPNVVRLNTSEYQFVPFQLKEYKGVSRPRLLSEDKHDFFFVKQAWHSIQDVWFFLALLVAHFPRTLGFSLHHKRDEARSRRTLPFFSRKFRCKASRIPGTCLQAQFENADTHLRSTHRA